MARRTDVTPQQGQGIIRGALATIGIRLIDIPSRYGFHLLIAASLGVLQAGEFYIVFSFMTALAGLGRLGIDRALTRQIAVARAEGRAGDARRITLRAFALVLGASALVAALLAAGATPIAGLVLRKPDLAAPLMLGALSIIPQNLSTVAAGGLAGLQRVGLSQMIYSWLWPALFCVIALIIGTDVAQALILIAVCFALAASIGIGLFLWFLRETPAPSERSTPAPLFRPGLSLFTAELSQLLISSAPAIILGMVSTDIEVGLYAIAWRLALLINIVISGIASMATPRFAGLHAGGDTQGLSQVATQAVGLGLALAILPALAMLAAPVPLLRLVGQGYEQGASALRILAVGQLIAAGFTGMPELLGMTNHMSSLRRVNAVSALCLLAGSSLLSPFLASDGAALATSLAVAINGAGAGWAVRRHLGIAPLNTLFARLAALAVLAAGLISSPSRADERPPRFDVHGHCAQFANGEDGYSPEAEQKCAMEQYESLDATRRDWNKVPDYAQRDCERRARAHRDEDYQILQKCIHDQLRQEATPPITQP